MSPENFQAAVFRSLHRRDLVRQGGNIGIAIAKSVLDMTEELAMWLVEKTPALDGEEDTLP